MRPAGACWFGLTLAACAGTSPRPAELAARELPRAADSVDPQQVEELVASARRHAAQRRFDDAVAAAESALALDPRAARARALAGWCRVEAANDGQPPPLRLAQIAEGEIATARRLAPADPVVAVLQGRLLLATGHLSAAAAAAEDCLHRCVASADPDYLELLSAAGEWCYELGEEQRAAPHLAALTGYRPDDATAQFRLGSCLLHTATDADRAIEAATAFARCAELSPGDDDAHLAVVAAHVRAADLARRSGRSAVEASELERAASAADAAVGRFPTLAEPLFRRGVVAELRGDAKAASAAYAAALDRAPDHLGALLNLAGLLAASPAEAATARDLWQRALETGERHGTLSERERRRLRDLLGAQAPRML